MLDQFDDAILKIINDSVNVPSFQEIADLIGMAVSTTHRRIGILVEYGLIEKKERGKHRKISLTDAGTQYLEKQGLIKDVEL